MFQSPRGRSSPGAPLIALLAITVLSACAHVKLVADYDNATNEATLAVGRRIDLFYGKLEDTPDSLRTYDRFAEEYREIEADLNELVRRNQARPLNSESTKISQTCLDFWKQYREKLRKGDGYPDRGFDHTRFDRLINAAVAAEQAKQLESGDQPPISDH